MAKIKVNDQTFETVKPLSFSKDEKDSGCTQKFELKLKDEEQVVKAGFKCLKIQRAKISLPDGSEISASIELDKLSYGSVQTATISLPTIMTLARML
jgi:hypothetical protein